MTRALPRILFVYNDPARFVEMDFEMLQQRFPVTKFWLGKRGISPAALRREVGSHDLVFGWFASWHTFLPMLFARLLGKQSMLVIGGYDVANLPKIGYGHQRGGLKKLISRWTMRLATGLVTNSYYSREEAGRTTGLSKERVHVIYHGVPDPFRTLPAGPRARMALTVGNVDRPNLWRKGHEPFVRTAALLPDTEFALVGAWKDDAIDFLRSIATPNVKLIGRVEDGQLLDCYRQASVYVQPSAHEGFGLSVAEAMLAGCIPVVTDAGALPEVVGTAGLQVRTQDPACVASAIRQALELTVCARHQARERILTHFPMDQRRELFEELIINLSAGLLPRPTATDTGVSHGS